MSILGSMGMGCDNIHPDPRRWIHYYLSFAHSRYMVHDETIEKKLAKLYWMRAEPLPNFQDVYIKEKDKEFKDAMYGMQQGFDWKGWIDDRIQENLMQCKGWVC